MKRYCKLAAFLLLLTLLIGLFSLIPVAAESAAEAETPVDSTLAYFIGVGVMLLVALGGFVMFNLFSKKR